MRLLGLGGGGLEVFTLEVEGDVDEADEDGDLDERADDGGEGGARVDAEHGYRDGDGQLEVVAGGGEADGGGAGVVGADFPAHPEAHEEHDDEVDQERDGDADDIEREADDHVAFEAEHDEDGEQKGDEGDGADFGNELPLVASSI